MAYVGQSGQIDTILLHDDFFKKLLKIEIFLLYYVAKYLIFTFSEFGPPKICLLLYFFCDLWNEAGIWENCP